MGWKGYSHLHNTWESEDSLKVHNAKGLKKVDNFSKRQDEIEDWKSISTPEDVEYMECQLQMQQELQASYTTVERIVDMQGSVGDEEYPDYYVKWKNLPYAVALSSSWPWIVRMSFRFAPGSGLCGGSIIDDEWV